jgi:hypothetical protein
MVLVAPRRAPEKARTLGLTKSKTLPFCHRQNLPVVQPDRRRDPRSARRRGTSRGCS